MAVKDEIVALLPDLRAFARFMCREREAADDLVQNTILAALDKQAQFTPGNLAVFRAESASANNTAFSIIEINPAAAQPSPVSVVAINGTTGANALRTSGSASSTGYMSTSNDGSLRQINLKKGGVPTPATATRGLR